MKTLQTLIAAYTLFTAVSLAEVIDTNAEFKDNSPYLLSDAPAANDGAFIVQASFKDQKKLLSYNQGDWEHTTYVVSYELIENHNDLPKGLITFIVEDKWPAEGSRIRIKKAPWPFRKDDTKTFTLLPLKDVHRKKAFRITHYKQR